MSTQLLGTHTSLVAHPNLVARILEVPDKYLCFCELAPSRLCMRGPGSPFSPELVRTRVGLFSCLVWQAITFGTLFAATSPMIFTSSENFNNVRNALGPKPDEYFCDKGAYGVSNPCRKCELAESYWEALVDGKWEIFVGDRVVPFMECYQWLMGGKPKWFAQLGSLAAYLLTVDLLYSGVIEVASEEEMALIIRDINKGAVSALERLCLITPR